MHRRCILMIALALAPLCLLPAAQARHLRRSHRAKRVAYDAKDRRYYSVAWAKAHGMRDRGGDPLTIVRRSSLPRDARESRAMRGARL